MLRIDDSNADKSGDTCWHLLSGENLAQSGLLNYDEQTGAPKPRQDAFYTETSFEVKVSTTYYENRFISESYNLIVIHIFY